MNILKPMTMKEYSIFPKPLTTYYQMIYCPIQNTYWGFLPLCRGAIGTVYRTS